MENIVIRPATITDLDTLLLFEQGVISAERAFDPTLKTGQIHYYDLAAMMQSPQTRLLIALVDDQPAGCGYARIETSKHYLRHPQHAYLGFMYVLPEYRGKGINKLIISALKSWSAGKGVVEMRLEVYVNNVRAIAAYEKAGFTRHMIEMRQPC
jgi:ribosomal protein S18 acetylase RimI-like enzyme